MGRLQYLIIGGATASLLACFAALVGVAMWMSSFCADCCHKEKTAKPAPAPKDALQVHRWYHPTRQVSWSWARREWGIGEMRPGASILNPDAPLYCVERRGNVAVLRGAVSGTVLVPDGRSTRWFQPVDVGEIGEMLPEPD